MDSSERVLELLVGAGEPVSGEELARQLGVSRNTVWKAVGRLRGLGYVIDGTPNRGYRLAALGGELTVPEIRRQLTGAAREVTVQVEESLPSTNDRVKELAEQGAPAGLVLVAREQTRGKGRLGRRFYSPRGTGLYMSLLLRPEFDAENALWITTAAAVAAARAIEAVAGKPAGIKWVNDVYLAGYKVCGILTEASVDFETRGLHYAVLGLGINLQEPPMGFGPELEEIAGALFSREETVPPGAAAELAARVINEFYSLYERLPAREFLAEYRERSVLTGLAVSFLREGKSHRATVLGIDDSARLLVRTDNGEEIALGAGEVQIDKEFLKALRGKRE